MKCTEMRLLHLGAGNRPATIDFQPVKVTINDIANLPHVNWCYDLNSLPWPLLDSSHDYIYAHDIIEHLDKANLILDEMIRVCTPGGRLDIQVPMSGSLAHTTDITHVRGFAENSFGHYMLNHPYCLGQPYFTAHRLELLSASLDGNYNLEIAPNGFIRPIPPELRLKVLAHQTVGNLRFMFKVVT
jgi:SAM-dependent methyltransferase